LTSTSNDALKSAYVSTLPRAKPLSLPPSQTHATKPAPTPHHEKQVPVSHNYHDHSNDPIVDPSCVKHKAKGGVTVPFPVKLHAALDDIERDGFSHIISWQPHGRCFVVHKPKEFVSHIMPKYFKQSKMASFQRQLNLYGFNRLTGGLDKGGYYHELFLRGKASLAYNINRMRVKGTGVRMPTNPDSEPNLYALPPVAIDGFDSTPPASPVASSAEVKKPLMAPQAFNLEQRHAELDRESEAHSKKINTAAASPAATTSEASAFEFAPPKSAKKSPAEKPPVSMGQEEDLVFFEGCPFHYLDPNALAPAPRASFIFHPALPSVSELAKRPTLKKHPSTVSESSDDDDSFLPSFSADNMDWEGPLASLDNIRMKPSIDEDVETFFSGFEMPLEKYHAEIEQMDGDDTAFGYLLERAISD
jgi:hypothetical protein